MTAVAILSHWHTGSSLLAHTLRACGMNVGNEKTYFNKESLAQCEHSIINRIGNELCLGKLNYQDAYTELSKILTSYKEEAEKNNWGVYGIKTTHALYDLSWPVFKKALAACWGDVFYVTTFRHYIGVMESTKADPSWTRRMIMDSLNGCGKAVVDIGSSSNLRTIRYPNSWMNGEVQQLVNDLGLTWTKKASKLFDIERVGVFSEYALMQYMDEV